MDSLILKREYTDLRSIKESDIDTSVPDSDTLLTIEHFPYSFLRCCVIRRKELYTELIGDFLTITSLISTTEKYAKSETLERVNSFCDSFYDFSSDRDGSIEIEDDIFEREFDIILESVDHEYLLNFCLILLFVSLLTFFDDFYCFFDSEKSIALAAIHLFQILIVFPVVCSFFLPVVSELLV